MDSSRGGTERKCPAVHGCPRQSEHSPPAREVVSTDRGVFCSGPPRQEAELRGLGTATPAPAGLSRPGLLLRPGGLGPVTMLGIPSPPPAQRRLPIPDGALSQAHSTPKARRVLDAFLELYRHGCGERRSLNRGPRRVERHPRPVDGPSHPRSAPRPPARPPRNEAGAPLPRPACHRRGASPKCAAACTTRCHLQGASLNAPLHPVACHRPLSSATRVRQLGRPRRLGFGEIGPAAGKGRARLSHFGHPCLG